MSDSASVVLGVDGQIVVPSAVRTRRNWPDGTVLLLTETEDGLLLTARSTALGRVHRLLTGAPLIEELIADRRRESAAEDATD